MGDPPDAILSASTEARPSWKVPCTAAKDRTCQIVDHLPKLNKLLCSIEFRLRELSEGHGQLAVVLSHTLGFTCFAEEGRRQAFGLLAWLLMSHPCVTSLYANEDFLREFRRGFLRGVLNDGNSALKSLKLDNRSGHHSETVGKIIASTAQLERLEVRSQGLDREIATAIVEALRTNMLTVLNLTVGSYTNDDAVDALLEALKANSTLRELSVNDNLFSVRRCAGALETVSRHPALMEELAEVLSLSDAELASLVRTRLREIQNVHDFMRLAGVVKDTVTCQPREDGRKQLHDLNEYCWGHVRRYLLFDDVRDSFETAHYVALQ
ncbi:hypothetical protein HPB52_017458 [Rhipicephalus sanguineus]|uniref:Uncharacterized protein n=1 Tax=Rhipicephalus sanguineus TaxID=34632 RepID=A0A9D4PLN2_RHISA|nr:hypothetical protein HPB52_017458 [Rhipicephalus sanguineus]